MLHLAEVSYIEENGLAKGLQLFQALYQVVLVLFSVGKVGLRVVVAGLLGLVQTRDAHSLAGDAMYCNAMLRPGARQARVAIRNMFLGDTNKQSDLLVPWCTYTEPEVAHVGKYEAELRASGVEFESYLVSVCAHECLCTLRLSYIYIDIQHQG